jgi:hypothetical protein
MLISDSPRHRKVPGETFGEKVHYVAQGKVSVGKFCRVTPDNDLEEYFLPHIRSVNFIRNTRKFSHPGYQTADQAYCVGYLILRYFQKKDKEVTA